MIAISTKGAVALSLAAPLLFIFFGRSPVERPPVTPLPASSYSHLPGFDDGFFLKPREIRAQPDAGSKPTK